MAHCRVSYRDIEQITHSVNVEADTLYETVAKAVQVFRNKLWDGNPPGPACELSVEVHRDRPTVHKVTNEARWGKKRSEEGNEGT